MKNLSTVAAAVLLATSSAVYAQSTAVTGLIKDHSTTLPGAIIKVLGTDIQTVSDYKGNFALRNLPAGKYQLEIVYVGYSKRIIDVVLEANQGKSLGTINLNSGTSTSDNIIEEVVSIGVIQRGEMAALNTQKNANNILSVISSDNIGKLPDRNAAEAVQRIPGVSIERDQGEGRFVAVRGLPSQWSSASVNGNRLPTAEEETTSRATAFDFFPSDMIELVEVSKAITPDMDGDAIGGNVNFITRTAPDERIFKINGSLGTHEQADGTDYSGNILFGDRSEDGRFGYIINANAWVRDWATDNFEPRRGKDGLGIRRLELRDYTGKRETYGINAAAEYELDNGKVFASLLYGTLIDDETHYKHRYRFDKDRVEVQHIHNELITEMKGFELGGEHDVNLLTTIDWRLSSFENEFRYGDNPNGEDNSYFVVRFDQKNVGYVGLEDRGTGKNYAYNRIDSGTDRWNAISNHLPNGFQMDPAKTKLAWVELYKVFVNEKDRIVAQLNAEHTLNAKTDLKFGLKYRDKVREAKFSDEFYAWNSAAGPVPTLADFSLVNQPGRSDFLSDLSPNYASQFSQVIPVGQLNGWWNTNKKNMVLVPDESALVSNGGALGRHFDVNEQHTSAYGMATYHHSNEWTVLGGLRLTQTDTEVDGFIYLSDQKKVEPINAKKDYLSVLPSLHLTYSPNEDMNYRLALGRTFARPDFGSLSPGATYSEADNEYSSGNPELDPTYSNNLDLIAEYYFGRVGIISAGFFYKDIKDPIFQSSSIGEFNGKSGVTFFRPQNGDNASLYGFEFTLNSSFEFIGEELANFGIMTNATIMDSEMKIPGRSDEVKIPRQADLLYNIALYYDGDDFAARIALNHKGDYIEEHGKSDKFDSYYGDYTSLDMTASYYLSDHATIYLELNNLTDEPLHYYQGSPERPLQVEYYGMKGMIGFSYSL